MSASAPRSTHGHVARRISVGHALPSGVAVTLRDHCPALLAVHHGDASAIWSVDGVHLEYLGGSLRSSV